jgi:hypothetical protein
MANMKLKRINLDTEYNFNEGQEYLLTREGEISDHTGIYKYSIHYKDNFVLYSEDLQCYYTLPVLARDIRLYEIIQ